jgi:DNA-directed RNA polymerase specialized sigma24 family protein
MSSEELIVESTENLIAYMQWKNEAGYEDTAKNAFLQFFFRFQEELIKKTRVVARSWGYDNEVADLIAEKAFDRFWQYPNFDIAKSSTNNWDTGVLLYLFRIAFNLLVDYKKSLNGCGNPFTGEEEILRDLPDIQKMNLSVETKAKLQNEYEVVKRVLESLGPKHKIIYLTYKGYEYYTKQGYKLPRKLLENLREELNLTQSSIQVYKKEAFDKISEYLNIYGKK